MATVVFPKAELTSALDAVVAALNKERKQALEILGVQLLALERQSYEEKSHGRMGSDGIAWAPLKVSTILARLRKAGHLKAAAAKQVAKPAVAKRKGQRTVYTVAKTVKRNAALFRKLDAAGVVFQNQKGSKITGAGDRHRAGTTVVVSSHAAKQEVTISPGAYQIGVDTGLQRNSSTLGFVGPDGKGG
ncbi:MAG: hypothetical protein JWM11_4006, partial [Planctomycetaceae bacterium]|nr:hypothetical protein [Planctomycetaceae bacterium]